jgi:hypothetical protein
VRCVFSPHTAVSRFGVDECDPSWAEIGASTEMEPGGRRGTLEGPGEDGDGG